jgi:hypothetical protein
MFLDEYLGTEKKFTTNENWNEEILKEIPKQTIDTSKINRVEVIQYSAPYNGRAYTNCDAKDVEIEFQDQGRTIKIFLR